MKTHQKQHWIAAVALLVLLALPAVGAEASPPNIVLILADDLGWGDLSCYPQDPANADAPIHTPQLDSLAAQGVRFTQAYSQNMCSPARAALLTGRFPQRFGFYDNGCARAGLPRSEKMLSELLREHGYATACIGKWHVGHKPGFRPLDRGFDRFYGFLGAAHDYFKPSVGTDTDGKIHEGGYVYDQDQPVKEMKHLTDQLTEEGIAFMRASAQARRPFFLYLPYSAPHGPLQPRPDTLAEFQRIPAKENGRTLTRALIDGMDAGIGRILRELFLTRLETNTLVIFASDNGGNEYESADGTIRSLGHNGGLRGTKFTTWEGGIRVPLIIRWPGRMPKNAAFTKAVNLVDVYATVAAAAGVEIPQSQRLDSVDLRPFVAGEKLETPHEVLFACNNKDSKQWSVRKGAWKLVNDYPDATFFWTQPRPETVTGLYSMAESIPKERRDLAAEHPEIAAELNRLYADFIKSCPPNLGDRAQ